MSTQSSVRWALLLGCTAGAGGAIARRLLAAGDMNLVGIHRGNYPAAALELQQLAERKGRRCVLIEGDAGRLSNLEGLQEQVARVVGKGELQLLVHACANGSPGMLATGDVAQQLHPAQVIKTFEVMAHSFLFWSQGLVRLELPGRGCLLLALPNFLDVFALQGFGAIAASKAALNTYVRYLAHELGPRGVRVNGLRFGTTPTDALLRMPGSRAAVSVASAANPMGRTTTPDDVADFTMLMLDPRAAWLNGSIVDLDGGENFALVDLLVRQAREAR